MRIRHRIEPLVEQHSGRASASLWLSGCIGRHPNVDANDVGIAGATPPEVNGTDGEKDEPPIEAPEEVVAQACAVREAFGQEAGREDRARGAAATRGGRRASEAAGARADAASDAPAPDGARGRAQAIRARQAEARERS